MRHRVRPKAREGLFRKQNLISKNLGVGIGIAIGIDALKIRC